MSLPPEPYTLIKELNRFHLQCYVWLNALKTTSPSLKIEFYANVVYWKSIATTYGK